MTDKNIIKTSHVIDNAEEYENNMAKIVVLDYANFYKKHKELIDEHLIKPILHKIIKDYIQKELKPGGILHDSKRID